ncbi:MAG: Glu/Leu/Phe/Val dehydrogenase [Deltaproteobacteria bacterium]|jgi:glutamate dehydrogenase/leucine dehydrogenase|nr:Glu/Leu/Phe/Val dehydrogenase [Deltaproteobacteria bacterium]
MSQKPTAYEIAMQGLEQVAKLMRLSDEAVGYLRTPQRLLVVEIPLRMDDGSLRFFTGYRAQHNSALGPVKGGTRLHPEETMDDVKALSFWMSIKNALANIPAGGAKGGIAVDPSTLSPGELERLCRRYIQAILPLIGPQVDIPGPDIGTPQQVMAWFTDEYERLTGRHEPAAFAGKPPILGGSAGRDRATGLGLIFSMEKILEMRGENLEGKKVVIQGYGNLGSHASRFFVEKGAVVTGISDVHGGIYNPKGLDIKAAFETITRTGGIKGLKDGDPLTNQELLELPCDLLVPCALQSQITKENADKIKTRYVLEGANGPTTPEAEDILMDKNICVIPDIVANVGGAVVAYFELVQDLYLYSWDEAEVFAKLKQIMRKTADEVCSIAAEKNVRLRHAAWMSALGKIITAMRLRGWIKH